MERLMAEETSSPIVHDEFGPSKHPALCKCPAFKSKEGDSVYTALGTWKHDQSYLLWKVFIEEHQKSKRLSVMDEAVKALYEKVREGVVLQWNEGGENQEYRVKLSDVDDIEMGVAQLIDFYYWLSKKHPDEDFEDRCEVLVPLKNLGLKKGGTPDVMFVGQTVAACMDYKYGQKIVSPWSEQILSYLSGVLADNPFVKWTFYTGIIQPTVREDKAWVVEVPMEHVERHANFMIDIVKIAKTPNPPRRPCEYCNYCADFPCVAVESKTALIKKEIGEVPIDSLTVDQAGDLYERFGELKQFIGALERAMVLSLKEGQPSENWELVEGARRRTWTDEDDAEAVLKVICKQKGIDPMDLYQMKFVSPSQAEKLVGKAKAVREAIANVVMYKHGELKLGRKSNG
jgi:hypothetical protein